MTITGMNRTKNNAPIPKFPLINNPIEPPSQTPNDSQVINTMTTAFPQLPFKRFLLCCLINARDFIIELPPS